MVRGKSLKIMSKKMSGFVRFRPLVFPSPDTRFYKVLTLTILNNQQLRNFRTVIQGGRVQIWTGYYLKSVVH